MSRDEAEAGKKAVDAYVQANVSAELQPVVAMIRELMSACAPQAIEAIAYGMPTYKGNKIFAYITANKKEITFGFTRGISFQDPYGLLKGGGKSTRHVKLKKIEGVNQEALRDYIRQALERDAR